ncbi:MliC family protein [Candidatus Symbiobacter mobilis]|uniref:C-type lysozyme inhibitor domain-containing protein n=1 Tax=Candidatus Symbiobacter mobilis CR TaxID=946483 RepID=U5NA62_9BURK|nr:MliC family protein [Candidatus Symbiobacter mobilis]AGX88292.1 hypothetical protein Cenrod_2225 [Candidatus Symbiobacter mobilis CR]
MKQRINALTLSFILLASACTDTTQDQDTTTGHANESPLALSFNYHCESGEVITASYPSTDTATIRYKGGIYHMQRAVSASGGRYVGDEWEWWTKGPGGMLSRLNADGNSGDSIEICTES